MVLLKRFMQSRSGATAIEYGLIAALLSITIISAAMAVGNNVGNTFVNVSGTFSNATGN